VKTITAPPADAPTIRLADGTEMPFYSAAFVAARLTEAGATLFALPIPMFARPSVKMTWWPLAKVTFSDAIGQHFKPRVTYPQPSAARIDAMDEALTWLPLVANVPKRRIVAARLLTHPVSGKPIHSFGAIADATGLHRATAQRWWEDGVEEIATTLTRHASQRA
jgi:hypothetical protein